MPEADVVASIKRPITFSTVVQQKTRWKVSAAALSYRIHSLGLISDWQVSRSISMAISRLGRDVELNSIPREQSQVLTKVLTTLRSEGAGRSVIAKSIVRSTRTTWTSFYWA